MTILDTQPHIDLEIGSTQLRLLGTAHVSRASAEAVQLELDSQRYDEIAIELCVNRHHGMTEPDALGRMDLFEVIRSGKTPMVTAMLAMGAFQQRIAEQFGIDPGAEMRAAIDGAKRHGLELHVIDRDIGTTLRRIYSNVPWYRRMYLFSGLFASILVDDAIPEAEIEALKESDLLESMFAQFAERERRVYEPLIEERDLYMAAKLQEVISQRHPRHLLAVVGAGHLKGIAQHLAQALPDTQACLRALETTPPGNRWVKLLPWLIVAFFAVGIAIGFMRSPELGLRLILEWVVITGGLSGLGTLIAGGHPLTILSAIFGAPFTTLHPAIGIGMITAPVEAWIRKPTVADFQRLRTDTTSLKGWRRNRVARTFVVFFLSSLGAALGTYVAGFRIIDQLVG